MRDRLIELIASKVCDRYEKDQCSSKWNGCCGECLNGRDFEIGDIADHLLANGVIVFPVKVGDIVFAKQEWDEFVTEYQVTNFFVSQNKKGEWTKKYCAMKFFDGKTIDWRLDFSFDEIGKTVLLAREEVEAKLERRKSSIQ